MAASQVIEVEIMEMCLAVFFRSGAVVTGFYSGQARPPKQSIAVHYEKMSPFSADHLVDSNPILKAIRLFMSLCGRGSELEGNAKSSDIDD